MGVPDYAKLELIPLEFSLKELGLTYVLKESTIDHTAIANIGNNTHAQLDTHLLDTTIHFIESSINHISIRNIGSNTHAQIDTHIINGNIHFLVGAIDHDNLLNTHNLSSDIDHNTLTNTHGAPLLADGSQILTSDWDIGDGRYIATDKIRARNGAGLLLEDDGGNGLFIEDGGNVGILQSNPINALHVGSAANRGQLRIQGDDGSFPEFLCYTFNQVDGQATRFSQYRARGTEATPLVVLDGDQLFLYNIYAKDSAANYSKCCQIRCKADDPTPSLNIGGQFVFRTRAIDGNLVDRFFLKNDGKFGIGNDNSTPTATLDMASDVIRMRVAKTPTSAGAAGNTGDFCWDTNFEYRCITTNSWERKGRAAW